MAHLPVSLARDTILECIFEMRFSGGHPAVSELLPGLVFGKLPSLFKNVLPTPLGSLPKVVIEQNPQFQYAATQALEGPNLRMLFGPRMASVSFPRPYLGWARVEPQVIECLSVVLDTGMTGNTERFSLKYLNLLSEGADEFDLTQTNVSLTLGPFGIRRASTVIRAETERNGCTAIIEVQTGTTISATPGNPEGSGVLLNVDTVMNAAEGDSRAALRQALTTLHETEKEIFFGLLTESTLKKLGPRYEQTH